MTVQTITARYVFPVDSPPLPGDIVAIAGDRIAAVEPHGSRAADVDLGNVAILPGLVNAHTHLDLTGLRGQCPPTPDFTQWLRGVIAHRRSQTPEQVQADIQAGIRESIAAGTTLVGDIAAGGVSWDFLCRAAIRAVVFYELLGLPVGRAYMAICDAQKWLLTHKRSETCWPGLSPHAPYSVHRDLFKASGDLARQHRVPTATHLAEAAAERELLRQHQGEFKAFLSELGVWEPEGLTKDRLEVMRYLRTSAADPPALFVHCNYLPPGSVSAGANVIYCPRTHHAFGHEEHPFRALLRRGVRVALGTDSLASNPDLDLLADIRFVHQRYPDVPGDTLLRMGTLSGAEALGWADETGSLTAGKSADLVAVPLPDAEGEPHQLLLESSRPVARTLFRGRWVHPA